jgi:hypothetical protein
MISNISITSSVVVIPFDNAKFYFKSEINSEGKWRDNVNLTTVLPFEKRGKGDLEIINWAFSSMSKARSTSTAKLIDVDNKLIDIGLVDIQIYFEGDQEQIIALLRQDGDQLFKENAKHIDLLSNGNIHDQMIYINALHTFDSKGKIAIHYHDVIFGVRVQGSLVATLDLEPLLTNCTQAGKDINFVKLSH